MKQVALEGFLKKQKNMSRTIVKAEMELFVALFSHYLISQSATGVLNVLLEYYNVL